MFCRPVLLAVMIFTMALQILFYIFQRVKNGPQKSPLNDSIVVKFTP